MDGDDFDPDEVTKFLGLQPTSICRKGSKISGKTPRSNSWQLSTENIVENYIDVFELSSKIIARLKPKKALILQAKEQFNISPRFEVVLSFSMDEEQPTPAIGFDVETVQFLGDIGAFIDIDTYML